MRAYLWALVCLACAAASLTGTSCGGEGGERTGGAGDSGTAGTGPMGAGGTTTGAAGRGGATAGTTGGAGRGGQGGLGGAIVPGNGTNLFTTLLGKTQADVDTKLTTAVNRFFGIGTGEPTTPTAATGYRCYYELPQDASMAFIWAADSDDVRSEGMSYGMMIAVQMNMQAQFDRLWKFAKTYMQFPGDSGIDRLALLLQVAGHGEPRQRHQLDGQLQRPRPGPPPTATSTSPRRSTSRTGAGAATAPPTTSWRPTTSRPRCCTTRPRPTAAARSSTPARTWSCSIPRAPRASSPIPATTCPRSTSCSRRTGPSADATKWRTVAATSRGFLVTSAHATTGLHPDYATFAGAPTTAAANDGHNDFGYDAWRVVMNMAVDYAWVQRRQPHEDADREVPHVLHRLPQHRQRHAEPVHGQRRQRVGRRLDRADRDAGRRRAGVGARNRTRFVNNLWNIAQQSGDYRYYQECVYLLGLLNVAGKFAQTF